MEMRKAAAKSDGEKGEEGSNAGGSVWSARLRAGSSGPKGELDGNAKSISNGGSCARES